MKNIISILALFISVSVFSQIGSSENRFRDAETKDIPAEMAAPGDGPGNPGGDDDLPIDDYIPLLLISGVGIIAYYSRKLKQA